MSEAAARWFGVFHRAPPDGGALVRVRPPRWLAELGELSAVTYLRRLPGRVVAYQHTFAPHARPMLCRDDAGQLQTVGGSYSVTTRGITDSAPRERTTMQRESYDNEGNPVHGRREGKVPLTNPDNTMDGLMERAGDAAVVALVAAGTTVASDAAVERLPWTEGKRAVLQGAGCVALGVGADQLGMRRTAVGIVAGGVVGASRRGLRALDAEARLRALLARNANNTNNTTGDTGNAAGDGAGAGAGGSAGLSDGRVVAMHGDREAARTR